MAPRPFERARGSAFPPVIGCDEVGRGALCGPVVVAAVWFDPAGFGPLARLDDSKRLAAGEREALAELVRKEGLVCVAAVSAARIDRRGIRDATLEAIRRAVLGLAIDAPVRVDGLDVPPGLPVDSIAVVQGDRRVPQIAAASIVAKVVRDRILCRLAPRYPEFGWERNMGYGTEAHLEALRALGLTPHHRRSFAAEARLQMSLGL
jgi:ribonuclease HII